jgi:hypothetical protein
MGSTASPGGGTGARQLDVTAVADNDLLARSQTERLLVVVGVPASPSGVGTVHATVIGTFSPGPHGTYRPIVLPLVGGAPSVGRATPGQPSTQTLGHAPPADPSGQRLPHPHQPQPPSPPRVAAPLLRFGAFNQGNFSYLGDFAGARAFYAGFGLTWTYDTARGTAAAPA